MKKMGGIEGQHSGPKKQGGDKVVVNLDIDPGSELAGEVQMKLSQLFLNGPAMTESAVKAQADYINNVFPARARKIATPEMIKKEPNLVAYLKAGLFYGLYKAIENNGKIRNSLKKVIHEYAKKPSSGRKKKLGDKIGDDLTALTPESGGNGGGLKLDYIDPLLKDPLVKRDFKNSDLDGGVAKTVDEGVENYYDEMFEGELKIGHRDYTPTQKLVLSFFYNNYFKPISDNIHYLNSKLSEGDTTVTGVILGGVARDANQFARDTGRYVLKNVILSKDFDIHKLRNIILTVSGFIEDYNKSVLSLISSLLWKRNVVHLLMPFLMKTLDLDLDFGEGREGELLSVLTSVADLSEQATVFLRKVEKRKLEDVARDRSSKEENEYKRQKLLVQFLLLSKGKVKELFRDDEKNSQKALAKATETRVEADFQIYLAHLNQMSIYRNTEAAIDFALSMISRLKDDNELATLGSAVKPVITYLANIPGGIKDNIFKGHPELAQVAKLYPGFFDDAMTFFVPQRQNLSKIREKEFSEKYGTLFALVEGVVKSPVIPLKDELRYAITFSMENIKTYFGSKKDTNKILGALVFINNVLKPYAKQIPKYMELAEVLVKLIKELDRRYG